MIIKVKNAEESIPPIIGAAILCITSLPTPCIYIIGIKPAKIANRDARHNELAASILSDFYDINKEISEKYDVLGSHIKRLQTSMKKYGTPK